MAVLPDAATTASLHSAPAAPLNRNASHRARTLKPGIAQHGLARAAPVLLGAMAVALIGGPALAEKRANYFNDPFLQVTKGIADCPVPEGPMITEAEMR